MKRTAISLAVAAAMSAGLAINAQAGTVKTEGEDIIISTKNGGFSAKTESGDFSFKVGGKLQWDFDSYDGAYNPTKDGKRGNQAEIRRAEIAFKGTAYSDWKYKLKLKSDDDNIELDDAYIDYVGFDPVEVRIGRWGPDFGLENTVSSSWIMAIERPFIYDFMRGDDSNSDYGAQVGTYQKQYTAVASITKSAEDDNSADQFGFNFRGTFAPIMSDDMLVHLGLSYSAANPDDSSSADERKTRLGVHTLPSADKYTAFAVANLDGDSEYVLEGAVQLGSLQLQAEYFSRDAESKNDGADVEVRGYYAQASYMLDGGKRSYKEGAFGKPKGGQWEVFARMTHAEIDGKSTADIERTDTSKALEMDTMTLGVNYFATKNIRMSLNYIKGELDNSTRGNKTDDGDAISGRVQYVF